MIVIKNDGKNIVETNYFSSELEKHGIMFCSVNANCFRLLIPQNHISGYTGQRIIREMRTGKKVSLNIKNGIYTFTFDDGSDEPYNIQLNDKSFDRCISEKTFVETLKNGTELTVKAYAWNSSKDEMFEAVELPLYHEEMLIYDEDDAVDFLEDLSILINVFNQAYHTHIMSLKIENAEEKIAELITEYIFTNVKPNKNGKYIFFINDIKQYLLDGLTRMAK